MILQLTEEEVQEAITIWLINKNYEPLKVNVTTSYNNINEEIEIEYTVTL